MAVAATELRKLTVTVEAFAEMVSAFCAARSALVGIVVSRTPPSVPSELNSEHGIDACSAWGVWAVSGATTDGVSGDNDCPEGQSKLDVVWFTGSSGVSAHRKMPTKPAVTATRRAVVALDSRAVIGTSNDAMRWT
ncbi:hypothetical protein GCM10007298_08640 [Williamsia phyllosphaerae]|uniref:Uncharacterized protein n=1 Tax=Williamsia phyllosphaerae TaxID=885042 RepID=A0ABQ1UF49_9NOCA|nr:hypothetical protein GCM10007298_08640 [Williamsia phyllosphaerae]